MPKQRSEVFENYVKISEGVSDKELEKYKNTLHPRMDSNDIDALQALYGLKPTEQKYEDNIMQEAHPNAVVISPSYDKLNGLVENNIERHNIMVNIVNKPVDGHITHHKYAKKELVLELIRIANDMDNRNKQELRALADKCLEKINSQNNE